MTYLAKHEKTGEPRETNSNLVLYNCSISSNNYITTFHYVTRIIEILEYRHRYNRK